VHSTEKMIQQKKLKFILDKFFGFCTTGNDMVQSTLQFTCRWYTPC